MIFKASQELQIHTDAAALRYGLLARDAFKPQAPAAMEP